MNLGHSQAEGLYGWITVEEDTRGQLEGWGQPHPGKPRVGSLGPPEVTTHLCTSVASSVRRPNPSTCSQGPTVRIP